MRYLCIYLLRCLGLIFQPGTAFSVFFRRIMWWHSVSSLSNGSSAAICLPDGVRFLIIEPRVTEMDDIQKARREDVVLLDRYRLLAL